MIKFHDPSGTPHFGQATITRTTSVNGGLSLTGEVFAGDDVLNGLDYGWWLNFDNEKYVITYKKLSDDTNTVVFDAVQQFFWDFAKVALHAQYTGSHEYTFYLGQLFDKSGYTYKNDVTVPAFEKENWGYKNKLDLFNDIIDQAGVEFEVHNETVHIAKQIGSDLTSFARKGINLSNLTEEMKISDFATYAKGYGAFKDTEDQSKGRLEVEYRSELAKQFGDLEMDPIVDERYTIADNLIAALKKQVDATYTVSMTMNIYDLENAGYPNYEAPKVGDWILAIDETLNFKRKIRIIQLEEQFDVTGKRIGYTATCGDLSIVDQYTHLQSSLDSKVQRIQESVDNVAISANGKGSNYYGAKEPVSANEGDLWFDQSDSDPDKWSIKQWVNGRWEQITLNPGEVDAKVDVAKKEAATAVENAKSASDKADQLASQYDDTNSLANQALDQAVSAQSDASSAVAKAESTASEFSNVEQKADSALDSALSAQSDASYAVAKAESTASEFSNVEQKADSALDSALSAQSDASAAVTQASSAAADSKDAKQIAGAVSQSYKTLTDGSTMTLAELESGLAAKLTRTDLDGYATETWAQNQINVSADAINTTLSSVKSTVDGQTTSINDLKADSSSFKSQFTTVNNTIGKQTTDISSLQASSKELTTGFNTLTTDNTTNKNDISQLKQTATEVSSTLETVQTQVQDSSVGTNLFSQSTATGGYVDGSTGNIMSPSTTFNENVSDYISVRASSNYTFQMWGTTPSGAYYWYGIGLYDSDKKFISRMSNVGRIYSSDTEEYVSKTLTTTSTTAYVRVSFRKYNNYKVKLEKGSVATDYSVNPEDTATVTAVSKLSQTVDGIKLDVSKKIEQKDLDGYSTQTWSQGQITAAKNEISASVETVKQQVDNLQIGGRNLVPNFGNTYSGWAGWVRLRSNDKWEILEIDGAKVLHIVPSDLTIASGVYNWYPVRRTDGLDVNGKEWSASLEIKGAVTLSRMGIENSTNTSGNYTSQKISDPSIWTKLESHGSHKGDISSGGAYVIYAFALNSDGFYIRYPTVNAGNLAMQWQDAPESQATIDWTKSILDMSEGKVSAQVQSVKTDLNNATNTLNNNIANATADMATETWVNNKVSLTVDGIKTDISKKIEQTDLNGYATETWTQSQLKLTSDSLSGTLSSVKSTVDGHTTSINDLKADSTGFKAQFTTVNNTLGKQTTDISTLQASANSLSASFDSLNTDNNNNKHDISQLQATAKSFSSTLLTVQQQVTDSAVGTNLLTGTSGALRTYSGGNWSSGNLSSTTISLIQGQTYTARMWIQGYDVPTNLGMRAYDAGGSQLAYVLGNVISANSSGYSTVTWTAESKWTSNVIITLSFASQQSAIHSGQYKELKVEKGSLATDWCPNPADNATVTAVSSISQTVEHIQTTVHGKVDNDTYQSDVKQLSGQIESVVKKADDNFTAIQQTASDINLRVEKKGVINAVNVSTEGIQIYGDKLHITATTYIDDAIIKSAMIDYIDAEKIKVGTLDATKVNIIHLNADNITAGTIRGANLTIGLDNGDVEFQHGRIHSADNTIDININSKYISVANDVNRVMLKNGELQFVEPSILDTEDSPYLRIHNRGGAIYGGTEIIARDYVSLSNAANSNDFYADDMGLQKFSGLFTGYDRISKKWRPTVVGGAERGVIITGGSLSTSTSISPIKSSPRIVVGYDNGKNFTGGNRILLDAAFVHSFSTYSKTSSQSPNVYVSTDGALLRSTSASKYKTNIVRGHSSEYGKKLINLPTATWIDKASLKRYNDDPSQPVPGLNYGMIAEDLAAAGLEYLVVRNRQGELEGIQYDRIAVALLPLLSEWKQTIDKQQQEINELKKE